MKTRLFVGLAMFLPFVLSCQKADVECEAVEQERGVKILVFRYHPALLESEAQRDARKREIDLIHRTTEDECGGFTEEGGLGRGGYQLFINSRELRRWRTAIDKLMKSGQLQIYNQWDVDRDGFGFTPMW